ncbi:GGDEF domain-containing protein [Noviherbaspirillum sp. CPCC 100848]|uniref:diguanylate cyclase n=1 Tax=Noviherbaspirillum album TaxID=3080276 RepID=A0ABU6J5H5_9BURK|nr:GGDEF domain-containing protein [Noviherbaspirillum sp. CPCC 100848]MEC4718883.1 GGDEF domain-containing protein [Noviherbaspirillum sp. CPCC 100848]
MPSAFNILVIGALFCVVMLLVLISLLRSGIPGVREWSVANGIGFFALVLYALGQELPELAAYELANGTYAAASAAILAGFRRFFGRKVHVRPLLLGVLTVTALIALFHYAIDSFALRTATVALYQGGICFLIAMTISRSRQAWRSHYPYVFTVGMAGLIAFGHAVRAVIYLANPAELTSLLQPSPWNLFFLSAGTFVLPVLTIGAVMMVHDTMMAKAEHAANRDFLTGAWSRRALFELAERELSLARRTNRPMALLMLDIDNFKSINDTWGHTTGDRVLMDAVLRAETAIRSIDYFARVGGEEFAVLLPETGRTAGVKVAERIRVTMEGSASAFHVEGQPDTPAYTVSIGLAMLRDSDSFQELMRRADAALYAAKASGRNRVACD